MRSSHAVLKWLHHLEDQYVTLLHWAEFWHDWEHAARLSSVPGELSRYPLFDGLHARPTNITALPLGAVVAGGVVSVAGGNLTVVAPLRVTRLSHVVLKWLHHLEA